MAAVDIDFQYSGGEMCSETSLLYKSLKFDTQLDIYETQAFRKVMEPWKNPALTAIFHEIQYGRH